MSQKTQPFHTAVQQPLQSLTKYSSWGKYAERYL